MRPCRSPFVMTARSGHGSAFTGRGDGWQCRCGALINGVIMSGSRLAVRNSGRAALSPEWSIPRVPSCMSNMVGLSRVCRYWRSGRALCAGLCTPAGIACGIWGTACAGTHIPSAMCDDVPRPKRGSGFRVCGSHFGFGSGFVKDVLPSRYTVPRYSDFRSDAQRSHHHGTTALRPHAPPRSPRRQPEPPARRRPVAGTRGRADSVNIRYLDDGSTGGGQPSRIAHLIRPPHTTPAALKFPPPQ